MARGRSYCFREFLPFTALISVECTNVGMNTLYKAAVRKGLSYHVYMVYSYAISALILLPLAFLFHRYTAQYLGNLGIKYSSPTLGSAMSNLTPACTFFLAIIFRMEKLKLRSLSSQAKVIGAMVSIAGGLRWPDVDKWKRQEKKLSSPTHSINLRTLSDARSNWILGGALLAACYIVASIWYIFQ